MVASSTAGGVQAPVAPAVKAVAPAPFQISSIHEQQRWLKLFIYGNYGTGKTRLAASAALVPQMQDMLMVDAEAGDLTVATDEKIGEVEIRNKIDVIRINSFAEFARIQEYLKLHCKYRDEDNITKLKELESRLRADYDEDAPPRKYYTVMIDSLTELEAFAMYNLLGITERTALDADTASAEWAEYKKNNTQLLRAIRAYRDLPMNVIITAAAASVQNDMKQFVFQPALTGKLAKQVQGFMDMVGFLAIVPGAEGTELRRLFVQPGAKYDAKNRFSNYKDKWFDDPTVKKILGAIGLLEK